MWETKLNLIAEAWIIWVTGSYGWLQTLAQLMGPDAAWTCKLWPLCWWILEDLEFALQKKQTLKKKTNWRWHRSLVEGLISERMRYKTGLTAAERWCSRVPGWKGGRWIMKDMQASSATDRWSSSLRLEWMSGCFGPAHRCCGFAGTSWVTRVRPAVVLTGVCGLEAFCRYVIPFQPYMSSLGRRTADGRVF